MIDSLQDAAVSMNGRLHGGDQTFHGVSIDTRSIQDGELFFALSGPNFDGHDYVAAAQEKGATAAVVSSLVKSDIAQIQVDDARLALGQFGAACRSKASARVVGITGSNGKTTLKELVAACLSSVAPTLATAGNLNNEIGMPLMLSRIEAEHEFAVIEMGANHAGEIAYLVSLARPDVVVITNAGAAHLEGFGSIEGVAKAKGEILQNESRPSFAILNADDRYFGYWQTLVEDVECLSFGFDDSADVRASDIVTAADHSTFRLNISGSEVSINLPLPGEHNVRNACAAAAVASVLGLNAEQIRSALEGVAPVGGRLQALPGNRGCTLFDDSYNANPLSVTAAADFIAGLDGQSWLVLGDMKELGANAMELHGEVGASARASGVNRLFALGELARHAADAFGDGAMWFENIDALIAEVSTADASVNVLVKGSRSMRMERVVEALQATDGGNS